VAAPTLDVIRSVATGAEIIATVLAFAFVGWGLRAGCRLSPSGLQATTGLREGGTFTLVLGALWLVLTILTGISYLSDGVDELKGAFQRADQVAFGAWLLVVGWAAVQDAGGG
jgi:hypothetical protein